MTVSCVDKNFSDILQDIEQVARELDPISDNRIFQKTPGIETVMVNFRSDNAFMTTSEMEAKQRTAKDLKEALWKQIEEKKQREV